MRKKHLLRNLEEEEEESGEKHENEEEEVCSGTKRGRAEAEAVV